MATPMILADAPKKSAPTISGTQVSWHMVVLWYLGAIALVALAGPAPNIATWIAILLIVGLLLSRWSTYQTFLGI